MSVGEGRVSEDLVDLLEGEERRKGGRGRGRV